MVTSEDKNKMLSDLLNLANSGNKKSYEEFLNKISSLLRPIIVKKIINFDVEDVLQEILLSIHKARHTYNGDRPIIPWIIAIANFRMTDYLRKYYAQMRHKTLDIQEMENILADIDENFIETTSINELFDEITPKNKEIITMMHLEGFTAKEVGERVGMSESAVKVAAHRAIKKIRNKFKI